MGQRALHECNRSGCRALTRERYCSDCKQSEGRRQERERGTAHERGYGSQWQTAREAFLEGNKFCIHCLERGNYKQSTTVDHKRPHRGDMVLFWNRRNWQALCRTCHNVKTATEDGGFGRGASPAAGD